MSDCFPTRVKLTGQAHGDSFAEATTFMLQQPFIVASSRVSHTRLVCNPNATRPPLKNTKEKQSLVSLGSFIIEFGARRRAA